MEVEVEVEVEAREVSSGTREAFFDNPRLLLCFGLLFIHSILLFPSTPFPLPPINAHEREKVKPTPSDNCWIVSRERDTERERERDIHGIYPRRLSEPEVWGGLDRS